MLPDQAHSTSPKPPQDLTKRPGLWPMFFSFVRIGSLTIGGGMAMLPLIEREFVSRRSWIKQDEMVDIIAVSQTLPGVIAINSSLMTGYRVRRLPGALVASAGMILPSFSIILLLATLLGTLGTQAWLDRIFAGVRAGISALILLVVLRMAKQVLRSWFPWLIALCSFAGMAILDVNFIYIILGSSLAGLGVQLLRIHGNKGPRPPGPDPEDTK